MFRYVNNNDSRFLFSFNQIWFLFAIYQCFLARQAKITVLNKDVLRPNDGFVNIAHDGVIFVCEMFLGAIFPPVLEHDEQSVFDKYLCGRLATATMLFFKGFVEDCQHFVERFSFHSEEFLELSIAECQCFLDVFGLNDHWLSRKREKIS